MKRIIEAIKNWWRGNDAEYHQDQITGYIETTKPAYRHWLAKTISLILNTTKAALRSILKNPNVFITQLFAFLALVLAASSLYLQFYENDDEYKRCTITNTDQHLITMKCKK